MRKRAKVTVGLTIDPKILDLARQRNLNLSRIFEQSVLSIIEYLSQDDSGKVKRKR